MDSTFTACLSRGCIVNAIRTDLEGVLIIEPKVFGDDRGFFFESFNQRRFNEIIGREVEFVQDNHSKSARDVCARLALPDPPATREVGSRNCGCVQDVAVDIRKSSPTFGKHVCVELSAENKRMLWIPEGFAHGFRVISETAEFLYKTTDYWAPEHERSIAWDDPELAIDWMIAKDLAKLSQKDMAGVAFASADYFD
jgi:dTDP-4-dehydrorhamnose 3,5-epimerase